MSTHRCLRHSPAHYCAADCMFVVCAGRLSCSRANWSTVCRAVHGLAIGGGGRPYLLSRCALAQAARVKGRAVACTFASACRVHGVGTGLEFIDPTVKARRAGPPRLDTTQTWPLSHCPTEDKRIYTHNTQIAHVHRHFLHSAPSYGRLRPPRRTRRPGRRESRASRDVSRLYPVPTGCGVARW